MILIRLHDDAMKGLALCRGLVNLNVPEDFKKIAGMNA